MDSSLFTSRQLTNQISGRSAHIWGFGTFQPHSLLIRPTPMAVARLYINLQARDALGSKAKGLSFNMHGITLRSYYGVSIHLKNGSKMALRGLLIYIESY